MDPKAVNLAADLTAQRFSSFSDATRAVLEMLERQLPGSAVFVGHLDEGEQRFRIVDSRGDASFDLEPGTNIDLQESFCIRMAAGEAPMLTGDAAADPVYGALAAQDRLDIRSYAGVPLEVAGGERIGSLCAIAHDLDAYSESDLQLLRVLANLLAYQLERDKAQADLEALTRQLREQATTDGLTGLLNRRSFDEALEREWALVQRDGIPAYLVMLDLDSFKQVNDTRGHAEGDRVLVSFARTLRAAARRTDFLGRIGGDEFAALLVRAGGAATPLAFIDRVRLGSESEVSAGFVAIGESPSAEAATRAADEAMYRDKRARQAAR